MKDLIFVFVSLLAAVVLADKTVWFDELPLEAVSQGWKSAAKNRSVEGNALSVGGKVRAPRSGRSRCPTVR